VHTTPTNLHLADPKYPLQDENRHGDFFTALLKARPEYLNDWQAKLWSRFFCHSVYITMYLNDHQRRSFYESIGLNTTQFNQHVIVETNNSTARLFPAVCHRHFILLVDEKPLLMHKVRHVNHSADHADVSATTILPETNKHLECRTLLHIIRRLCVQVPDTSNPEYFPTMDKLVELNTKLLEINCSDAPEPLKKIQGAPVVAQMAAGVWKLFWMSPLEEGSADLNDELATAY
jgi:hypothetical protein